MKFKWVIGIDEAGRGPLAGPVAVGVVLLADNFNQQLILGVKDSKKITAKKREEIFDQVKILKARGELDYAVTLVGAKTIDQIGIVAAIKRALNTGLTKVTKNLPPTTIRVLLDGGLKAPERFLRQETIIKGDDKEFAIGLASILAKVKRDQYMNRVASQRAYLPYGFSGHKGYGTLAHRQQLERLGLSELHRVSFCRNLKLTASKDPNRPRRPRADNPPG